MQFNSFDELFNFVNNLPYDQAARFFDDISFRFATDQNKLISEDDYCGLGVRMRDAGYIDDALRGFKIAIQIRPSSRVFLEILIIIAVFRFDEISMLCALSNKNDAWIADSAAALMVAHAFFLLGNIRDASTVFSDVKRAEIALNPFFLQIYIKLKGELLFAAAALIAARDPHFVNNDLLAALTRERAASRLRTIKPSAFEDAIRRLVFTGAAEERLDSDLVAALLVDIKDEIPYQNRPVAFRMLVSLHKFVEAFEYKSLIDGTPDRLNPDYVKSLVKLSELTEDPVLLREANNLTLELSSSKTGDIPADQDPLTRVRFAEIKARAHSLLKTAVGIGSAPPNGVTAADRHERHLFVGFFGQLRYPKENFQGLLAYIENQLAPLKREGWDISYGVSTWNQTGRRPLLSINPIGFLLEILPLELHDTVSATGANSIEEFGRFFPNTTGYLLRSSLDMQGVNTEFLTSLARRPLYTDITDEGVYHNGLGADISRIFGDDDHYINQGKMWNRIHGLRRLIDESGAAIGKNVSYAVLVRPDLMFPKGDLGLFVNKLVTSEASNVVFTDEDVHASFIEGLGDRYMLCDRPGLDRILDGYKLLEQHFSTNDQGGSIYQQRLTAHQFLGTVLFEGAVRNVLVPRSVLPIELYRGRRPFSELRGRLLLDAQSIEGSARERLLTLLGLAGDAPGS